MKFSTILIGAILSSLVCAGATAQQPNSVKNAASSTANSENDQFQISYRGTDDPNRAPDPTVVGNYVIKLVPFNGKLYASTGVVCDKSAAPIGDGDPLPTKRPGPEVLV